MSGIKETSKKIKMNIDEMYDTQSVGNLGKKESNKEEKNKTSLLDENPNTNLLNQLINQPEIQAPIPMKIHSTTQQNEPHTKQSQPQKAQTYKMTFNLTEDIYKSFNDLYANRMLQGRKTEKSELIIEAIQCLIKKENTQ